MFNPVILLSLTDISVGRNFYCYFLLTQQRTANGVIIIYLQSEMALISFLSTNLVEVFIYHCSYLEVVPEIDVHEYILSIIMLIQKHM